MSVRRGKTPFAVSAVALCLVAPLAHGSVTIYGSPGFNQATSSGFISGPVIYGAVGISAGNGVAITTGGKRTATGDVGSRGLRWEANGTLTELGTLTPRADGYSLNNANAVNASGTAVGDSQMYVNGQSNGTRAVRWNAGSSVPTELGGLGSHPSLGTNATALAINDSGAAVGYAWRYANGSLTGERAVRWDANSTVAIELGNLGLNGGVTTFCAARAINAAGTAVGEAEKYENGGNRGYRAVRWDAGQTAATELGGLGTSLDGSSSSYARVINTAGTIAGYAVKYSSSFGGLGNRAVRWNAAETAATELEPLGLDVNGRTDSQAYAIADDGTVVGSAQKYVGGSDAGLRAVRWDASGTAATELGNLGLRSDGYTETCAYGINANGFSVGYSLIYLPTTYGRHAVAWGADGVAIDLNTLIAPDSGWVLTEARSISTTNWVTGVALFDPDGGGPLLAYNRAFLLQIPEPTMSAATLLCGMLVTRRRRDERV